MLRNSMVFRRKVSYTTSIPYILLVPPLGAARGCALLEEIPRIYADISGTDEVTLKGKNNLLASLCEETTYDINPEKEPAYRRGANNKISTHLPTACISLRYPSCHLARHNLHTVGPFRIFNNKN